VVRGGCGEPVVREARGVGDVETHAYEKVEFPEGGLDFRGMWEGDDRIAGDDDEGADAVRVIGEHVVSEDRRWRPAEDLRGRAHAGRCRVPPAADAPPQ